MGIFSSLFGSGNKSAYDTRGLAASINNSNSLYKTTTDNAIAAGQPWLQLGTNAAGQLNDQLSTLTKPFSYDQFTQDPSYQFQLDQGNQAIERSAAARGSVYAPSTSKALADYTTNMANRSYGDAFNRDLQSRTSMFDILNNLSGTGQQQAGQNAQYGYNYADSVSNNNIGLQNAILGASQAKNSATQSSLGNWINLGARALGGGLFGGGK